MSGAQVYEEEDDMMRFQQQAIYSPEDDVVWEQYRQMNIRRYPAHLCYARGSPAHQS